MSSAGSRERDWRWRITIREGRVQVSCKSGEDKRYKHQLEWELLFAAFMEQIWSSSIGLVDQSDLLVKKRS